MSVLGRDEQELNFLKEVLPDENEEENKVKLTMFEEGSLLPSKDEMIFSSYMLTNAMLNLLLQNKFINQEDLSMILEELHRQMKGDRGN